MQEAGRGEEACGVRQAGSIHRHFSAVGKAMEQAEKGNQRRGSQTGSGAPKAARPAMTMMDAPMPASTSGSSNPDMPSAPPASIAAMNDSGKAKARAPADDKGQNADGNHRQHMVKPADRMHEAMDKTGGMIPCRYGQKLTWKKRGP